MRPSKAIPAEPSIPTSPREKREIALQALLMRDRQRFMAEYKRALGLAADATGPIGESYGMMIDEILNVEFSGTKRQA